MYDMYHTLIFLGNTQNENVSVTIVNGAEVFSNNITMQKIIFRVLVSDDEQMTRFYKRFSLTIK